MTSWSALRHTFSLIPIYATENLLHWFVIRNRFQCSPNHFISVTVYLVLHLSLSEYDLFIGNLVLSLATNFIEIFSYFSNGITKFDTWKSFIVTLLYKFNVQIYGKTSFYFINLDRLIIRLLQSHGVNQTSEMWTLLFKFHSFHGGRCHNNEPIQYHPIQFNSHQSPCFNGR